MTEASLPYYGGNKYVSFKNQTIDKWFDEQKKAKSFSAISYNNLISSTMNLPTKEQQKYIEGIIETRFDSSIDYTHVLRWLDNFADKEQDMAIEILSKIRYYKYDEILKILKNGICKCRKNKKKKLVFLSVGKAGKSGDFTLYCTHKIMRNKGTYANNMSEALPHLENDNSILILVDDIIGSGNTFCNWIKSECSNVDYGEQLKQLISQNRVKTVCVVVTQKGLNKIKQDLPKICVFGDVTPKSFSHTGSLFGGSARMILYRDMCHKYGNSLAKSMPLGYQNSQTLVVFSHTTPNNTLPIIWADKKVNGKPWFPLFPKSTEKRIVNQNEIIKNEKKNLLFLGNYLASTKLTVNFFLLQICICLR